MSEDFTSKLVPREIETFAYRPLSQSPEVVNSRKSKVVSHSLLITGVMIAIFLFSNPVVCLSFQLRLPKRNQCGFELQ